MESTAVLPPPIPAATPPRADFADWLSPMLVKELRQGVRTRVFVAVFILLQVAMLLDLTLSLLVAASHLDASAGTVFFWLVVAVPLLLIVPFTGLNAISSEVRANTLELIFLTRLTAYRIVFGKWFALFAQSLLLVCATLPYLVLRYFMGGVNLAGELVLLGLMLLGSALLTALTTGLSAFPVRLIRPLAAVGGIFMFFAAANLFFSVVVPGRLAVLPGWIGTTATLVGAALLLGLTLDFGAARIAPPAENHTGFMRGLALAGLALAAALTLLTGRTAVVTVGAFLVTAVVAAVAVCEQPRYIPSLYRPFTRWGLAGRLVGRLFYPGWPSGVLFALVAFGAFAALFARQRLFEHDEVCERFVAALGTLLFPTALAHTLLRQFRRPVAIFFLTLVVSVVVLIFFIVCDNALSTHLKTVATYLPFAALLAPWSEFYWGHHAWRTPVVVVTALSGVAALAASFPVLRLIHEAERASLALPDPPRPEASSPDHVPLA